MMKVLLALSACLCLSTAQFTPGPKPDCSPTTWMAHETYCDMYYRCLSPASGLVPMKCGLGTQWDSRATVCNYVNFPNTGVCQNWQCNGNNYPDVCCDKYWTCTKDNAWQQKDCPAGTTFDMASGQCLTSGTVACVENKFCSRNFVNNPDFVCYLKANPTGDTCTYIAGDYVNHCPAGSSFNQTTCSCSNVNIADCKAVFDFSQNKVKDPQCRASFKTEFTNSESLYAFSDKLGKYISDRSAAPSLRHGGGFYLGSQGGVAVTGNEAVLRSNGFIYANYFAYNEIHAPTAFVVTFRPTNFPSNSNIQLLTNSFSYIPDIICGSSISVNVRNDGFVNGVTTDYRYTFTVTLNGQNKDNQDFSATINDLSITLPQASVSSISGESGSPLNFLRLTLTIDGNSMVAQVQELNNNLVQPNRQSRTAALPIEHLSSTRCGLTVGSDMTGSVREFTVYEGCDNGFVSLIN